MTAADRTETRRRLTPAALDDVCRVLAASDIAVVGFADFTPDDVLADLRQAGSEAYGWYDADGTLQGYGWVTHSVGSNQVELDLYVHPSHDAALGHHVLADLEQRGRALVTEAGSGEPCFGSATYRTDTRTQSWLTAAGYELRTTFTRMRIDLASTDGNRPDPADVGSLGVVVRQVTADADLRVAYEIEEESFVEHYGHVRRTFDQWHERLTAHDPDWVEVFLAEVDGRSVGVMVTTRQFEADDNAGYVHTLGVVPAGRGRGVAKAMLRHAFEASRREGRTAVLLHVDVANVTGALRLYESVGMRPVMEIDAFAKGRLSAAAPATG